MKRAAMMVVILSLAALALWAQQTPAPQNPPAGQTGAAQTATPPAAKRLPQAKTQPEYQAYQAAMAKANDPAALESGGQRFCRQVSGQRVARILLYKAAMNGYRNAQQRRQNDGNGTQGAGD